MKRYFYNQPHSTLTINGQQYKLGDELAGLSEEQLERHRFRIRVEEEPAPKKAKKSVEDSE